MKLLKKSFKEKDLKKENKKKFTLIFIIIFLILLYLFIIFVPVSDLYNGRFIEFFVVLFLMLSLLGILFFSFKAIYNYKVKIISEIRKNKIDYLILIFVVLVGLFLRTSAVIEPTGDPIYYHEIAKNIINSESWHIDDDLPGLPILIIFFRVLGYNGHFFAIGSVVGSICSSITILLIFIWLKILFNNKAGLFGAIALCFSTLNLESSVNGMPFSTSLFFVILGLIFIELAINTGRIMHYFTSAMILSFSVYFYFVEFTVIPIIIIYILLRKKINYLFKKQLWLFVVWVLVFITPLLLLNLYWINISSSTNLKIIMNSNSFVLSDHKKMLCLFSIKCENLYFDYFDKKHIIKYSSYLLLGKERQTYLPYWPPQKNKRSEDSLYPSYSQKSYFEPSYSIYLFFSLIAILGSIFYKKHIKKCLFLLLLFFSFLSFAVIVTFYHPEFLIYAETLGLIPLVSYGAYMFTNKFSKNKIVQSILFGISAFLLMLPFIRQGWYSQMKQYAYFDILHIFKINLTIAVIVFIIFYFVANGSKTSRKSNKLQKFYRN